MKHSCVLILVMGVGCGLVSCRTSSRSITDQQARTQAMTRYVDEYLITGEVADNFNSIKTGGRLAVEIVESAIFATNSMSRWEYEHAKHDLRAIRQSVQVNALRRLQLTQTNFLNEVEQDLSTEKNAKVIGALKSVRESLRARGQRLAVLRELLPALYASVAERILTERLANLKEKRWDSRTVLFFTLTPYEVLKSLMPRDDAEGWGAFCLFLFYQYSGPALSFEQTGRTILVDDLKQVSGDDLLKVTAKIWPVELQPLHQSGSYLWTLRAAERSSTNAHNVVRMSVDRSLPRPVVMHIEPFKEARFTESGIEQYIRWNGSVIGTPGKVWDSWIKAAK